MLPDDHDAHEPDLMIRDFDLQHGGIRRILPLTLGVLIVFALVRCGLLARRLDAANAAGDEDSIAKALGISAPKSSSTSDMEIRV